MTLLVEGYNHRIGQKYLIGIASDPFVLAIPIKYFQNR